MIYINEKYLFVLIMLFFLLCNKFSYASVYDIDEYNYHEFNNSNLLSHLMEDYFICYFKKHVVNNEYIENKSLYGTNKKIHYIEFEEIPIEIIYLICKNISPLYNINLSMSSQFLKKIISNKFWEIYIIENNQEKWDKQMPAAKVAYAYSLFERGRIKEASHLGLPKAIRILNRIKKQKKKPIQKNKESLSIKYLKFSPETPNS